MKSDLLEDVKTLTVAERIELAEAIWDTVAEDAGIDVLPVSEAHRQELDRRLEDLDENRSAGSSWKEVRSRLERDQ
jgi:putative addiction module component (TIGR02574 family)